MRILLVYCHPRPDSFAAALRDAAIEALRAGGHEVELRDLYAEDFRPAMDEAERGWHHTIGENLGGIEDHVAALRRAEALLLVYPTWWYGMPAMLKGWFDRVWVPGVAWQLGDGVIQPCLTNIRRFGVITTYGSPLWLLWALFWPDRRVLGGGLRRLCGPGCKMDWLYLTMMDTRPAADRATFIAKVRARLSRW